MAEWGGTTSNSTGGNTTVARAAGYDNVSRSGGTTTYSLLGRMGFGTGAGFTGSTTYSTNQFGIWIPTGGTKYAVKGSGVVPTANTWYQAQRDGLTTTSTSNITGTVGFGWNLGTSTEGTQSSVTIPIPQATGPSGSVTHSSVTQTSAIVTGTINSWGDYSSAGSQALSYGTTTGYGTAITSGATISGLSPSTTYYYRQIITNSNSLSQTNTGQFTTLAAVAPTVTVSQGTVKSNSIEVTVSGSGGTGAITSYSVSSDNGTNWTNLGTGTTHTFTGLSPNTTYQMRGRAFNAYTNGTSVVVPMTTLAVPTISAINYVRTNVSIQVNVTASAPSGAAIRGYTFSNNGGTSWTTEQAGSSYTFSGLAENTLFNIRVRVYNVDGLYAEGGSQQKTIGAPVVGTIAFTNRTSASFTSSISWTNEADGDVETRAHIDGAWSDWEINKDVYNWTGLTPYTNYTVQVQVRNVFGQVGTGSNTTSTLSAPAIINSFFAHSTTPTSIQVQVNATSGVSMTYQFSSDGGTTWTTASASNRAWFYDLALSTEYPMRARVINVDGEVTTSAITPMSTGTAFKPRGLRDGDDFIAPITMARITYLSDGVTDVESVIENMGKGGHDIRDENDTLLPKRDNLQFMNTVLTDDEERNSTVVDLSNKINSNDESMSNLEEIEYEDYMTLVETDTDNPDTTYFIKTDAVGSPFKIVNDLTTGGTNSALSAEMGLVLNNRDSYSSTETIVGKWVDGSNIYRKVYTFSSVSNITIAPFDKMIKMECLVSNGQWRNVPWLYGSGISTMNSAWHGGFYISGTTCYFQFGDSLTGATTYGHLILEYTKATVAVTSSTQAVTVATNYWTATYGSTSLNGYTLSFDWEESDSYWCVIRNNATTVALTWLQVYKANGSVVERA